MARYIDAELLEVDLWDNPNAWKDDEKGYTVEQIKNIPTADVEEIKYGHWVTVELKNGATEIYCSNCHWGCLYDEEGKYVKTPCCPHCGAEMDEEAE